MGNHYQDVPSPVGPADVSHSAVARNLVALGQMSIGRLADTSIFASTGLVVAGYGERELFPSVITNRLDFRLNGHLKHQRQESKSNTINFERRAAIITTMDVLKPIFSFTAACGNFGRSDFYWKRSDKVGSCRLCRMALSQRERTPVPE